MSISKQDPLFALVKSMSKAETRNFKLYAMRQEGNRDAKFIRLFDVLEAMADYDEAKVLRKSGISKVQLPNTKAHLMRQILVSIRLLQVSHDTAMELREQIDFAGILYNKGLYSQSLRLLDKAKQAAVEAQKDTIVLEIIEFEKLIETLHITRSMTGRADTLSRQAEEFCGKVQNVNDLSNLSIQLYGLYLKLGYARSKKDLDLIVGFFKPKIEKYKDKGLNFTERIYFYQAYVWYYYIQHDFLRCYAYSRKWVDTYDRNPGMKLLNYDNYIKGYSRLLDGLFYMRSYGRFVRTLDKFESEREMMCGICNNADMLYNMIYLYGEMNKHFMQGTFGEGIAVVPQVNEFLEKYEAFIDEHHKLLLYYKAACMYFGNADYEKSIVYLTKIIGTKDHQVRRDLQCFARILNLISSYELGRDYTLEYNIKSVYAFLIKMNDMHNVQKEMMGFLKKLTTMYASDFKKELRGLHERLLPLASDPYERRPFFYLDIISWIESKLNNTSITGIIRERFKQLK